MCLWKHALWYTEVSSGVGRKAEAGSGLDAAVRAWEMEAIAEAEEWGFLGTHEHSHDTVYTTIFTQKPLISPSVPSFIIRSRMHVEAVLLPHGDESIASSLPCPASRLLLLSTITYRTRILYTTSSSIRYAIQCVLCSTSRVLLLTDCVPISLHHSMMRTFSPPTFDDLLLALSASRLLFNL